MRKILLIILGCIVFYTSNAQTKPGTTNSTPIPVSFLNFKLGTKLKDFNLKYPDKIPTDYGWWILFGSVIEYSGFNPVYKFDSLQTKSGDKVKIYLSFYNNNLALITVAYDNGLFAAKDVLTALRNKYGRETSSYYYDQTDQIQNYVWKNSSSIMNYQYIENLGDLRILIADKGVQNLLKKKNATNASKSIE